MNLCIIKLFCIIFLFLNNQIHCELALPSYDYDHGYCPYTGTDSDVTGNDLDNTDCGYTDRWFIDKNDHTCKPFEYKKSGGNFNNFATQASCQRHLILTHNEKSEGCTDPPASKGLCVAATEESKKIKKWTFFKDTQAVNDVTPTKAGDCVEFEYSGCGGNYNRYDTKQECINACRNDKNGGLDTNKLNAWNGENEKPTVPNFFDCFVKPDVKDATPPVHIIADLENKRCIFAPTFPDSDTTRRGVFDSFSKCVTTCYPESTDRVQGCQKDTPDQYEKGSLEISEANIEVRFYYHKQSKICKRFDSFKGDFDPKKNNFPTLEMCASYCGAESQPIELTAEETCLQPKASVYTAQSIAQSGNLNIERYYYNKEDNTCSGFQYGGIGGNSNNFKDNAECEAVCKSQLSHIDLSTAGNRCPPTGICST